METDTGKVSLLGGLEGSGTNKRDVGKLDSNHEKQVHT